MNYLFLSLALTAFATAADKPNIVWIVSEDNSAHWLGCYGNKYTKTPNIDALAAQGVLYNAAFSNAPVCAIARSTLLMGRYATSMGTQNMRSRYPIPKTFKSYPQLLQEAGYHTHNASKTDYNIKGNDKAHWNVTGSKANPIKAPKGKPFISVINLMVSHESSLFASKIKNNKKNGTIPKTPSVKPEDVTLPPYLPDTKELRNDWVTYVDNIQALDKQVGKIVDDIKNSEHADNTIIFYYSDHGGVHPRSKRYVFHTGTHVPLIVSFPKKWQHLSPHQPGSKVDDVVAFVDFAPTVLNLAGAKVPSDMQGQAFLGKDAKSKQYAYLYGQRFDEQIFKFVRGLTDGKQRYVKNFHPHRDRAIFGGYAHGQAGWRSYKALFDAGKLTAQPQLIWNKRQPPEELFNTANDPSEVNNLISSTTRPAAADTFSKALHEKMIATKDSGIVPEMMYEDISKASTVHAYVNHNDFPYELVLKTAWETPKEIAEHRTLLQSKHTVVRYWAVMQCSISPARGKALLLELTAMAEDTSPAVQVALAEALHLQGKTAEANTVILKVLENSSCDIITIEALKITEKTGLAATLDDKQWNAFCRKAKGGYSDRRTR